MDSVVVGELLRDFRSIKLRKPQRDFVNEARAEFETNGALPRETVARLREMASNYSRQFKELYDARERARETNGLRRLGITRAEAERRSRERERCETEMANDLGI